jgi:Acyl-CoA reductase (LuxC)
MNLPNYFLANLPPEAVLLPTMIAEACQTLKRNREQYLASRSTESLIKILSRVADGWLEPENSFRKHALELGPAQTGFSRETLARGLDNFFSQLTRDNFHALLMQEFGDAKRLDALCATPVEQKQNRSAILNAPEFQVHIAAGNIPNPTLTSIVFGLLTRSAQFVKCASGATFLPRLFAHSIYEADAKLGACLEVAEWRGGNADLENVLFAEADCVTATGSDETLAAIRAQLPIKTRFLGYGHRVSFGFVGSEELYGSSAKKIAARAADDVVAWNQLGCLSPHVIYVQLGGEVFPEHFAQMLADELEKREVSEPRGELPAEHAATIASRRGIYEIRAAHSPEMTQHWCSKDSTAWTVVYEADARFQMSCLNRFIYVKGVADLTAALQGADDIRGKVSTVGIAVPEDKAQEIATQLARWGATRICPLGQMQNPPLAWRHDGRPALGDLVTWSDWEQS